MSSESSVQRMIWLAVGARSVMFRLNTGKAWVGNGPPRRNPDGSATLFGARPVALGFSLPNGDPVVGASDLIGWTPVKITAEMVGSTVAVMTAIEAKRSDGGKASSDQQNFIARLRAAGGIAGVANTPAIAQSLINDYVPVRI